MKVKVIKAYYDLLFERMMNIGEVFNVDETRFKVLTGKNNRKEVYVKRVKEKIIEEATEPMPNKETAKRTTRKKKSE